MRRRKASGYSMVEFAAVLMIGLPLLLVLTYTAMELTHFFAIQSALDCAARSQARAFVVGFNNTGSTSTTPGGTVAMVTIPKYVVNAGQYNVTWDSATAPTICQVTCTYTGGSYGLPPFPSGPLQYFATQFNLGNFKVVSNVTLPVQ